MLKSQLSRAFFKFCHGNHLVYNTCWEDPRLDRVALNLKPGDRALVITSAGCNALDTPLTSPTVLMRSMLIHVRTRCWSLN